MESLGSLFWSLSDCSAGTRQQRLPPHALESPTQLSGLRVNVRYNELPVAQDAERSSQGGARPCSAYFLQYPALRTRNK